MSLRIENREGRYILTDGMAQRDPTGAELEFWMRLADLEAEVRRVMQLGKYAGRPAVRLRATALSPSEVPLIAALLTEEAGRV